MKMKHHQRTSLRILALILFVNPPIIRGQTPGAQTTGGAAANPAINLLAQIHEGRAAFLKSEAAHLGIIELHDPVFAEANKVFENLYADVAAIEEDRNRVITNIRKRKWHSNLGRSFLNSVFQRKAIDSQTDQFRKDYDAEFIRICAKKNDLHSIAVWKQIRTLLEAGELPLIDLESLTNTQRPARFDEKYKVYEETAGKILGPIQSYDLTLPARIDAVQKQYVDAWFTAYSDKVAQLSPDQLKNSQAVKTALESKEFAALVLRICVEPISKSPTGSSSHTLSATTSPSGDPLLDRLRNTHWKNLKIEGNFLRIGKDFSDVMIKVHYLETWEKIILTSDVDKFTIFRERDKITWGPYTMKSDKGVAFLMSPNGIQEWQQTSIVEPTAPGTTMTSSETGKERMFGYPPQGPVSFPLADPVGLPPLPNTKCRIVVIPLPFVKEGLVLDGFKKIEDDDFTDIVKLGSQMVSTHLVAINADGIGFVWDAKGKRGQSPKDVKVVSGFKEYFQAPVFWLSDQGRLIAQSQNKALIAKMEQLQDIVYINNTGGVIFAITKDGKRHLITDKEEWMEHPNLVHLNADLPSVSQILFAGRDYINVIRKDGTWDRYVKGSHKVLAPSGSIGFHFNMNVMVKSDGTLGGQGLFLKANWERNGKVPFRTISYKTLAAFQQDPGGSWQIAEKINAEGPLRRSVKYETALRDAVEIRFQGAGFLYALLPAETVPRSGLWDLDELAAARKSK